MKGREIFKIMQQGKRPPRIAFVPSIYEHSAKVIGRTPSEVAVDENLIVEGQLASYDTYKHDLISVGVDIYNVEAEALGAKVQLFENEDIPAIQEPIIKTKDDFFKLKLPDPEKDGRMPYFLRAVSKIHEVLGSEVLVNGTVVGPFTLAAIIRGFEDFITDIVCDTDFALKILKFTREVSFTYARSFIQRGVGLSINESWISPPLLSPKLYKNFLFPVHKDLITRIKEKGLENVAVISGGNTTSIAPYLVETGTSLLMADYNTDQEYYKNLCKKNNIMLRASINSKLLENTSPADLKKAVSDVLDNCIDYEKLIFGCGVVSYNTSINNLLLLKKIVNELYLEKYNSLSGN